MTSVKHAARRAESSEPADWAARAGLVARGLLWFVVGVLAFRIALGGHERADHAGALQALREQPLGAALLVALALSFAAHAVFRLLEGTVGRRDEGDSRKRLLKRAWSLTKVGVYGVLAASTVHFLVSGHPSEEDPSGPTARVLDVPAGRTLVAVVGAVLFVGGVVQAVRGLRQDFLGKLRVPAGWMRTLVKGAGAAGNVGRGSVYALVGWFLLQAAVTYDPQKAKSLDEALKSLADRSYGTALLLLAAVGLLSFAAWSFLEARYHKPAT